jgi:mRNA interferase RelE/StbE
LPRSAQHKVGRAIDALAAQPRLDGAKLLAGTGSARVWRLAVGDYRILYQVLDDRLVVLVIRVANRREAYGRALGQVLKQLRGRGP